MAEYGRVPERTRTQDGPALLAILHELKAIRALLEPKEFAAGCATVTNPPQVKPKRARRAKGLTMAFTYDLTTDIGKVRLLVPDNDATAYDLADAEIQYFLTETGAAEKAAAVMACKWLARKYSKKATFSADGLSVQYSARAAEFAARAGELEAELLGGMAAVTLDRQDGYHDEAGTSEYQRQVKQIYIDT